MPIPPHFRSLLVLSSHFADGRTLLVGRQRRWTSGSDEPVLTTCYRLPSSLHAPELVAQPPQTWGGQHTQAPLYSCPVKLNLHSTPHWPTLFVRCFGDVALWRAAR